MSNKRNRFNINKFLFFTVSLLAIGGSTLTVGSLHAGASEVQKVPVESQIIQGLPNLYSTNQYVIAHESGNSNNTGPNSLYNEVAFMTRNWQNAFVTHWVGAGGKVIQVAPSGRASWGAGYIANGRAYAQVELARTDNAVTFKKDYASYVNLMRKLATEAGIPKVADSASAYGIKSHLWITQNLGGTDHSDPYSYLAKWGISKAQFQKDVVNGVNISNVAPSQPKPPVTPAKPKEYTVKSGDTLSGIGKSTKVKWKDIAAYNKIKSPYVIYSGQKLKLTGTATSTPSKPTPAPKPPVNTGWIKETGTYYPNTTINIRSGAGTGYAVQGQYFRGQSVIYDSYKVSGGYVWVHYISYSGHNMYMAIRQVNKPIWGAIY